MKTEAEFKATPRLRYRQNPGDGAIEAYSTWKKLRDDHITFWGPGELAIYVKRPTRRAFRFAMEFWRRQLRKESEATALEGDCEGLLVVRVTSAAEVPKLVLKRALSAEERKVALKNLAKAQGVRLAP